MTQAPDGGLTVTDEAGPAIAPDRPAPSGRAGVIGATQTLLARFLPQGAILLSVLSFAGYGMGLLRVRVLARTFGAGSELDAYTAAFAVPELLLDVVVFAGLAAPFVPVYSKLAAEDREAADDFGRTALTAGVLVMALISVVLFIVAPLTVDFVARGFGPEQRDLYTRLFRVMAVTPLPFAASIVIGELLVAKRRFLFYGLAPLLYNGGIVVGALLFSRELGIFGAALGAVLGALLHLGIRLVGLLRAGFAIRPRLALRTQATREFGKLMLPRMASAPIDPLTTQFFTYVASAFVAGSISSARFAREFQSVPVSLIGVAFSLAAFPALSAAAATGDRSRFTAILRTNVLTIGAITLVAGLILFLTSRLVIDTLIGGGEFDPEDVRRTSLLLSAFAVSVPLESLTYPLSRAIYATRNTVLPVGASVIGFVITVVATLALEPTLGLTAIPIGFTLGIGVKLGLLAVSVPLRVRRLNVLAAEDLSRPT